MEETGKKKLLIVITKSNFGGAQRYVFDLARSLKETYDISVACGGEGTLKERLEEKGIRTITIPFLKRDVNLLKDAASFFWIAKLIRKECPAIVHLNSSKIGILGALAAHTVRFMSLFGNRQKRLAPKVIFTAHAWAFNEDRGFLARSAIGFIHWLTVALSSQTIAVSEAVKKQVAHFPFISRKISVIHLGLEEFKKESRKHAREVLGIPERTFAIGTIAELHPVKGLSYAVEAMKDVAFDYSYTIIGEGETRKELSEIIELDERLKQHVFLKGFVMDAATLIPAFDVFLLPSLSEAFGYVLLEAGIAKTPVVATSVGGIPEVIEDMKSGVLIQSQNTKEIVNSVSFIYEHKQARNEFANALHERALGEFSLTKMIEKTVSVYESK